MHIHQSLQEFIFYTYFSFVVVVTIHDHEGSWSLSQDALGQRKADVHEMHMWRERYMPIKMSIDAVMSAKGVLM